MSNRSCGSRYASCRFESESGNVFFFILLGIVLVALITAALRFGGGMGGGGIDREQLSVQASLVKQQAAAIENAVTVILSGGNVSELDIRFAHPDAPVDYGTYTVNPAVQVFHQKGGGAEYKAPPSGINDSSPWEFYGHSALPGAGGDNRADLVAVLPNVTEEFCNQINAMNGYTQMPEDDGSSFAECVYGADALRFNDSTQYAAIPDTVDVGSFLNSIPAMEGCVQCTFAGGGYHFFHVLHAR